MMYAPDAERGRRVVFVRGLLSSGGAVVVTASGTWKLLSNRAPA